MRLRLEIADYILDLGPQTGNEGGNLVFAGLPENLLDVKESYTTQYLKDKLNQK